VTEGQTDKIAISISHISVLTRDKNSTQNPVGWVFEKPSFYTLLMDRSVEGKRQISCQTFDC